MAKGIYKRGNVYWIRYAGLDGRIIRESSHSSKWKEADDLLIERRNEIKKGEEPEIKKRIVHHTFNKLAEQYLKWAERQRSFQSKKYFIGQLVRDFGLIPLRQFSSMLLEQYQTERLRKGNKPATANRLLATLKHMFTKAVEWDMVGDETLKRIRKAKFLEENNRRLRYLSKEECQALINACDSHLRPIVITGLNTGMRKGEILGLTWDRVDFSHGFILLDKTKNGERREIPINTTLKDTLLELFHGTKERPRRIDVNHVFYDPATEKSCRSIKKTFPAVCRRAKITDFRFHDLRHYAEFRIMPSTGLSGLSILGLAISHSA